MKTLVDLYTANEKDNGISGTSVRTNALDADEFIAAFCSVMADHFKLGDSGRTVFGHWVIQAFDIIAKLRGYKSDKVNEQRLLWTGDVPPYHGWHVASNASQDDNPGFE